MRDARFGVIRQAHRTFRVTEVDENRVLSAVCEALCASGGYLHARVTEKRAGGAFREVVSAGADPGIAGESPPGWENQPPGTSPDPVVVPFQGGLAAWVSVPIGGELKMALLVAAPSRVAFDAVETDDLAALASRIGSGIQALRLAGRLDSLKKKYDALSVDLETGRDFSIRLLDLVPLPVLQIGPEGEIRIFNRRCELLTGYRASEALNRRMPDLLIPEPLRSDFRRLLVELFIGRRAGSFPFPLLTRSGDPVPTLWNFSPIRDVESGKIASLLACGETTNLSERP